MCACPVEACLSWWVGLKRRRAEARWGGRAVRCAPWVQLRGVHTCVCGCPVKVPLTPPSLSTPTATIHPRQARATIYRQAGPQRRKLTFQNRLATTPRSVLGPSRSLPPSPSCCCCLPLSCSALPPGSPPKAAHALPRLGRCCLRSSSCGPSPAGLAGGCSVRLLFSRLS